MARLRDAIAAGRLATWMSAFAEAQAEGDIEPL